MYRKVILLQFLFWFHSAYSLQEGCSTFMHNAGALEGWVASTGLEYRLPAVEGGNSPQITDLVDRFFT
jgi:hypothetical protein